MWLFQRGSIPAGADPNRLALGPPRVSDTDDVDVALFGNGDKKEGAAFCVLTFEGPAQLQPEVWPEDRQYGSAKADGPGCHGRAYHSVPGIAGRK